jgi:hypothetical protein
MELMRLNSMELVITVRDVGSKLDFKWKGIFKVVKRLFAHVYELEDLRTKKKVCVVVFHFVLLPVQKELVSIVNRDFVNCIPRRQT